MEGLLFDLETDGLLDTVTKIHCGVVLDLETGKLYEYSSEKGQILLLIEHLKTAETLAGQNICGYDMIVLEKLYDYDVHRHRYLDTRSMSRVLFPGSPKTSVLRSQDFAFRRKHGDDALPAELIGVHSLKAWSYRLRLGAEGKMDYTGGWEKWTPEMQEYCVGDVRATGHLLAHLLKKGWPEEVFHIESKMVYHLHHQEQDGVGFNEDAAIKLMIDLVAKRAELGRKLCETFPPITVPDGKPVTPKRNTVCRKYKEGEAGWFPPQVKGVSYQKHKLQEFNPASTQHIAKRLIDKHGWEPQAFTPGGQPEVTADILRDLPWDEAQQCADYQILKHILGYISEGKQAWLKLVKDGRIHGRVHATGAVTHRASHVKPNMANVPKTGKPYGEECRALFKAGGGSIPEDYVLVGCDAASLQLSIYAHFVARYDDGELARLIVDDGDPHEYMRKASGLFLRENQKTLTYAKWFSAGKYKLGTIVLFDWRQALEQGLTNKPVPGLNRAAALGAKVDASLQRNMRGYKRMARDCEKVGKRGYVIGLDGRRIPVPSVRLALVTLLQGNEAVVMKHAYILACDRLHDEIKIGLARPVLWIHDEFQWAVTPGHAETVGRVLSGCITATGESLGLRLKLGAKYKVGKNWAETH